MQMAEKECCRRMQNGEAKGYEEIEIEDEEDKEVR